MKNLTALLLALLAATALPALAQDRKPLVFSHRLAPAQSPRSLAKAQALAPDTVRVLAAMVAFQADNDDRTTGDGSFDYSDTLGRVIDAGPHNASYFRQHLTFLSNYYRKVSGGKLTVVWDILDSVYRMPRQMPVYSPPRGSTTNAELGALIEDAWHVVDSVSPGAVTARPYDTYVLFHAGAGRDIDLTALYGYDPTPLDIPSVYLGLSGLRAIFGASYPGVSVAGGSKFITNTMILPETESRLLPTTTGNVLVELSINGLLCASLGSYLGLPDLFDTKTGATGIGRFGLMDGQSIFSWNGVFPPEPSAWEKEYLGWITPITISGGDATYSFPAVSLAGESDSVYKVLISAKEYFLIENRNRDANRDGATVTMVIHDSVSTATWYRDTTGFNAFSTTKLYGVITDVDEFDWSLPGGVNTKTGEWFDGGMLIWHIDERIIDSTIAADAVNADADRRGVNLMEADGSQDIGQSYGFLDAGSGSENGSPFDYWYAGNRAPLRLQSNAFTPTSHPASVGNDGANSHIVVKEFTARSPRMSARIIVGDVSVSPLAGFPIPTGARTGRAPLKIVALDGAGFPDIVVPGGDARLGQGSVHAWRSDALPYDSLLFSSRDILRVSYALRDPRGAALLDTSFLGRHAGERLVAPVIADTTLAAGVGDSVFVLGSSGAVLARLGFATNGLSLLSRSGLFISAGTDSAVTLFTKDGIQGRLNLGHPLGSAAVAGYLSPVATSRIVVASTDGYLFALTNGLAIAEGFPVTLPGPVAASPALADVDGDGRRDIVVSCGTKIAVLSSAGFMLDNFPVTVPTAKPIASAPVVGDINGDGMPEVVAVTREGLVVAYGRSGRMIEGFPLSAGSNDGASAGLFSPPSACLSCTGIGLAVASSDGYLYAWLTGTIRSGLAAPPALPWPQELLDGENSGLVDSVLTPTLPASSFLPKDRAYNWPNPVDKNHGFKTRIRYYVASDAAVQIRIFDLAGDLVVQMAGPGQGGVDNEVEWDVSRIQSGVYFAHVDAKGTSGSGSAVIKIAVIK